MNPTWSARGGEGWRATSITCAWRPPGGRTKDINLRAPADGTDPNHPHTVISWDLRAEVAKAGSYKGARRALRRAGIGQNNKAGDRMAEVARERANAMRFDDMVRISASTGVPSINDPLTAMRYQMPKPPPPTPTSSRRGRRPRATRDARDELEDYRRMQVVEATFRQVDRTRRLARVRGVPPGLQPARARGERRRVSPLQAASTPTARGASASTSSSTSSATNSTARSRRRRRARPPRRCSPTPRARGARDAGDWSEPEDEPLPTRGHHPLLDPPARASRPAAAVARGHVQARRASRPTRRAAAQEMKMRPVVRRSFVTKDLTAVQHDIGEPTHLQASTLALQLGSSRG